MKRYGFSKCTDAELNEAQDMWTKRHNQAQAEALSAYGVLREIDTERRRRFQERVINAARKPEKV